MAKSLGKVHLVNHQVSTKDYPGSPHVSGAIRSGHFTLCRIITSRITDDLELVTCQACLKEKRNL